MNVTFGRRFWITTTAIIVLFALFFVGRNMMHVWQLKGEISALEHEEAHYRTRISEDSALVEQLRYDDYLEAYAREQFRMQRRDERVYIIE